MGNQKGRGNRALVAFANNEIKDHEDWGPLQYGWDLRL